MRGTNHIITTGSLAVITHCIYQYSNNYLSHGKPLTVMSIDLADTLLTHGLIYICNSFKVIHNFFNLNLYFSHFNGLTLIAIILLLIGSLLPDIDTDRSLLGQYVHLPIEHRTWTHTIWVCFALLCVSFVFKPFIFLFFGYFTHLFMDSLSVGGVCWIYPISNYRRYGNNAKIKYYHKGLYRSNSPMEFFIANFILFIALIMIYSIYFR